jgi:apolipoprotein N-acyltransferase
MDGMPQSSASGIGRVSGLWRVGAALTSGALMVSAFPPFSVWQNVWMGLVPLLLAVITVAAPVGTRAQAGTGTQPVSRSYLGSSFRLGFLAGVVFWLISLSWLLCLFDTSPAPAALIVLGWVLLAAYCALFWGGFTLTLAWCVRHVGVEQGWRTLLLTPGVALLWIGFEYGRGVLFGGFPWNPLGVSQYKLLALIQCAEWVGVPGVSGLIVLLNAGVAFTILRYLPGYREGRYRPHIELFVGLMTVALCMRSGFFQVRAHTPPSGGFVITAVQPAIAQVKKWTDEHIDAIHTVLRSMTEAAVSGQNRPDLVVWPETATPLCVTMEGESQDLVRDLGRHGVPLLVGSMDVTETNGELLCYNSSFLFDGTGRLAGRYDKQHLVPFGETVPLSGVFPWLGRFAPMGWNCLAGRDSTLLRTGTPPVIFSCLICFEDIMSGLSRTAVRRGARLLINQTNDAWFDGSAGPEQHMSHCVFRCIENRVPAVRVANSGVTCLIEPTGAVVGATENGRGRKPGPALLSWDVAVPPASQPLTLYARHGDWLLAIPCAMVTTVCFILALAAVRRNR